MCLNSRKDSQIIDYNEWILTYFFPTYCSIGLDICNYKYFLRCFESIWKVLKGI